MNINGIELKKCWHVAEWATEMIEGIGAEVMVNDGWHDTEKIIFFKKESSTVNIYYRNVVHFDYEKATWALQKETETRKNYYIKQRDEANKKIKELSN